jgi:hypothetical protein
LEAKVLWFSNRAQISALIRDEKRSNKENKRLTAKINEKIK